MPGRRLLAAALCALPLAACGGSSSSNGGDEPDGPGAQAYRQYACAGCHALDGSERTGPTFMGLAGSTVTLEDGKRVKADAAYLERSITDPDAQITKGFNRGVMQAGIGGFDLKSKPEEVKRLVEFIQSL